MVSIKDIARRANVSPSTVSRALHDHPRISVETKQYIQDLARSMGYVPSEAARSLVNKRSATIGVAIADFRDPFYTNFIPGVEEVTISSYHDLFVASFAKDHQRERKLFEAFFEKRVAGIIVAGSLVKDAYLSLENHSIPAVLVNCPSYPYSVSVDQFWGAQKAINYLISLGHRQIAYVHQGLHSDTAIDRLKGYRAALHDHGFPIEENLILQGEGVMGSEEKAVSQLLTLSERPTAIFCFNDMTAIGIMNTLQQRGFSIPQDFSVVGFDDLDIAAYCHPRLTTIQQPVYQLGYRATKMLFQRIQGNNDLQLEVIEPELIVRDSTAPVGVPVGGVLNLSKG